MSAHMGVTLVHSYRVLGAGPSDSVVWHGEGEGKGKVQGHPIEWFGMGKGRPCTKYPIGYWFGMGKPPLVTST